ITASPGRTPAAAMVATSAATSPRMSFAILVPSRILAGIRAPGFGFRASARKSYTAEAAGEMTRHRDILRVRSGTIPCHDCQGLAGNPGLSGVQATPRVPGESGELEVQAVPPRLCGKRRHPHHAGG